MDNKHKADKNRFIGMLRSDYNYVLDLHLC